MDRRTLRARFARVLAAALPAHALAGCCQASHFEQVIPESEAPRGVEHYTGGGDGGLSDGGNCRAFCYGHTPPNCADNEIAACGPGPAVDGGPSVRCEWRTFQCPWSPQSGFGACGRRPEGFEPAPGVAARDALGALFARMAELEGASVPAFARLRRELEAHGAPRALSRAAGRAARDEARHFRVMGALARRRGADVPRVARAAPGARGVRALERVAAENAAEGCVRETFGALVATWQARAAGDPAVREAMARIARDETSHAALAWRVDAWARSRLGPEARARVESARREAVEQLAREVASSAPPDAHVVERAGVPAGGEASALFAAALPALWPACGEVRPC